MILLFIAFKIVMQLSVSILSLSLFACLCIFKFFLQCYLLNYEKFQCVLNGERANIKYK